MVLLIVTVIDSLGVRQQNILQFMLENKGGVMENGFQYLPPISVEFSSQKICMCNNINMIVGIYWKI